MKDVDEALARAYGSIQKGESARQTPPGPHWSPRSRPVPASITPSARHVPATPHQSPAWSTPDDSGSIGPLEWPAVVLTLERAWADRFERMATGLIETQQRQNLKVILFTSCHRAEGRTTLLLTLARALARKPHRLLLVDADLSGPMLGRLLRLEPALGLDDVVERGVSLADALIEAPDDHLSILPLKAAVSRPRDFLASPAWMCTMARLRRDYDLILLDGGPLFTGLSAAVLHRSVDAAILVQHRDLTTERSLLRAREVLEAGGIPLLGLAETFVH
jgi:Mrp family chromosome partitioning ATPase